MQVVNRLLEANSGHNVTVRGDYIWLKSSTGNVHIKTDRGDVLILHEGDYGRLDKKFTEFYLTNLSNVQNDLTMIIAEGGDAGKYGGRVRLAAPTQLLDFPDVTITPAAPTLLLAANSARHEVIITSHCSNVSDVRVGSNVVSCEQGLLLPCGGSVTLQTTAPIYGYADTAEKLTISYTEY